MTVKLQYQKRFSMLMLHSLRKEANVVDREAVAALIAEAIEQGVGDEEIERAWVQVTYTLVPYEPY